MSNETELLESQVRLKKDGTLVQRIDGTEVTVAKYDRLTGGLEFSTKEYSVKLYNQVVARISTVNKGTQPSGFTIKSISITGEEKPKAPSTKRPRMREEGDGTPEVVDWYIKNALTEAIVRYGIYTDASGKPIRKHVSRSVDIRIDGRNDADAPTPMPVKGQSYEGGPVRRKTVIVNVRNAIIARRATRYEDDPDVLADLGVDKLEALFVPQEVVGGFQPDDDFESPVIMEVES